MNKLRNYIMRSSTYGKLMLLIGLILAIPLVVLPFYPGEAQYAFAFLIPSAGSIVLGLVVCILSPSREDDDTEWQSPFQKGSLPVLFAWCFAFFVGALPFGLSGQMRLIHALFESINGWTTAGFTFADVTSLAHIFLFYRSLMQYCGGLGFIIMIAMLMKGKQAMNLYNAEGHPDRLMPSLKGTARTISLLYSAFLVLGTLAYWIFGMNLFDAVCHTMSALSTAGFTTQAESIGQYGSLAIERITIVLMLIGASNFAILLLLVKRQFRQVARVSELRFMFGLVLLSTCLITLSLHNERTMPLDESFHNALFGVVTTLSTTGYSTMHYAQWPPFAVGLLMLLMFIGGGTGSTAGGIKLTRVYLLLRATWANSRKRFFSARNVAAPSYYTVRGKMPIDEALIQDVYGFAACYMGIFIVGTLLLTLTAGCSLMEAMFEFASALCTVGISNGLTNANATAGTLIVQMLGMILGRLEIFMVFIGAYAGIHALKHRIEGLR